MTASTADFATIVDAVHDALADATVDYGAYRLEHGKTDARRRVLWVPTGFEDGPPEVTGPVFDGERAIEVLCTEIVSVEAHIVGDDFADADSIKRAIKLAVHSVMLKSSRPAGGEYVTQQEGKAGHVNAGEYIVQRFRWHINVPKQSLAITTINIFEQSNKLDNDGTTTTEGPISYPVP